MKYLLLALLLCGCSRITVDPTTNALTYWRLGDQRLSGLEISKTETGVKVKLAGQVSEAQALSEAVKIIGVLAK